MMNFRFAHNNFNVLDLRKSLDFYRKALNLVETRRYTAPDNSYIISFLGDGKSKHQLELTWIANRTEPYDLGDNEFHLGFITDDFEKAYELHEKMGCICQESRAMGFYFIEDPDGYWIEIGRSFKFSS
jgi:lactoylglutathione lyase